MKAVLRLIALVVPLLLAACATEPEVVVAEPLVPTSIQLTFTGNVLPVLSTEGKGLIELNRDGADEPVLLEFQNGEPVLGELAPGNYSVGKIGELECRGMTFDVDASADARALGSLQAKIITTDYYVALMSRRAATNDELAELAAVTDTAVEDIDARPITVAERAPCFVSTSGPGETWRDRPLGEKILLGIGLVGFCAIAFASGGFCIF